MIATWISHKLPFKSDRLLLHRCPCQKVTTKQLFGLWRESILKNHEDIFQNTTVTTNYSEPPFSWPHKMPLPLIQKNHYHPVFSDTSDQRCVQVDQLGDLGDPVPSSNAPLKRFDYVPPDENDGFVTGDLGWFFFETRFRNSQFTKKWGLRKNASLFSLVPLSWSNILYVYE